MDDDRGHEHEQELDPLQRLRAADPAADVEPNAGFADEVVARAAAETVAEPEPPVADPALPAAPAPADLTAERSRRRPRWLPIAAVAASLVVVGALGYGVGATTGEATNQADGAAPPISLQGGSGAAPTEQGMMQGDAAATERMKMPGTGTTDLMHPYGFGRNQFHASGLSRSEGTALAYAFDARAASTADAVAALATALGVQGSPELKDGAWTVGPQDGTAASLWVSLDGTLSFSYSDPTIDPWQCADGVEGCEPPTGDLPGEEEAVDALRSLLASAGRDPAAFEFTSETYEGAVTRSAQARPIVDGQRVDQAWTVEITRDGLVGAYGALADLVALGDYPVVSEQEAFERLSDPRFGAAMTDLPIAFREQAVDATAEWVPPTQPPAAPAAGTSLAWPVDDVELVGARLGLASQWQPDGSVLVVPAYEFTDANGGTWSVIAVADAKLDFAVG
jgi:hypothetical protein